MSEIPACVAALRDTQHQLDVDGIMVGVSRQAVGETIELVSTQATALAASQARVEELVGALAFYANGNWYSREWEDRDGGIHVIDAPITKDRGRTAKAVLSRTPADSLTRWKAMERVCEAAQKFMTSGQGKDGPVPPWCTRSHAKLAAALAALTTGAAGEKETGR